MDNMNQPLLRSRIDRVLEEFKQAFDGGTSDSNTGPCAFAFIRRVRPVTQNGPQCGLVALHMAADLLSFPAPLPSVESIFERAKLMGFTNHGEMFSVQWLTRLASDLYPTGEVKLVEIGALARSPGLFLIQALLDGKCLLVPYDTDKNHEPCLNNGHTAHWALIIGFLVIDSHRRDLGGDDFAVPAECACVQPDHGRANLYWLTLLRNDSACDSRECGLSGLLSRIDESDNRLCVFALHGKSKHAAVWPLDKLLASNRNLREIGAKRLNDGLEYAVPMDGVACGLNGKMLVLG